MQLHHPGETHRRTGALLKARNGADLLYGVARSSSKRINRPPIGAMDMMIAAQAKSLKTR